MKVQLNISEDPNIYMIMDYYFATDDDKKDYGQLLAEADAEGNGFGFVYMYTVEKTVNRLQEEWNNCKTTKNSDLMIGTLNRFGSIIREAVDKAMQDYLFSHDGHIDSWPISKTEFGFEVKNTDGKNILLEFDYFSPDFSVQGTKTNSNGDVTVIGRNHCLIYRSGYAPQDTDEYAQMKAKLKTNPTLELSAEYRKAQQENEEYLEQLQQFADAWHKEWFEICDKFMANSEGFMEGSLW